MNHHFKLSDLPFFVTFHECRVYLVGQRHQNNEIKPVRMVFQNF